jgi:hypothetical protein
VPCAVCRVPLQDDDGARVAEAFEKAGGVEKVQGPESSANSKIRVLRTVEQYPTTTLDLDAENKRIDRVVTGRRGVSGAGASGAGAAGAAKVPLTTKRLTSTLTQEQLKAKKEALFAKVKEKEREAIEKGSKQTCSACGMRGHVKTNKGCPKYPDEQFAAPGRGYEAAGASGLIQSTADGALTLKRGAIQDKFKESKAVQDQKAKDEKKSLLVAKRLQKTEEEKAALDYARSVASKKRSTPKSEINKACTRSLPPLSFRYRFVACSLLALVFSVGSC